MRGVKYPMWLYPIIFVIILVLPMPFDVLICAAILVMMRNRLREAIGIMRPANRDKQDGKGR